jgi:hypothetical protein
MCEPMERVDRLIKKWVSRLVTMIYNRRYWCELSAMGKLDQCTRSSSVAVALVFLLCTCSVPAARAQDQTGLGLNNVTHVCRQAKVLSFSSGNWFLHQRLRFMSVPLSFNSHCGLTWILRGFWALTARIYYIDSVGWRHASNFAQKQLGFLHSRS